jgi:hypothetical protein
MLVPVDHYKPTLEEQVDDLCEKFQFAMDNINEDRLTKDDLELAMKVMRQLLNGGINDNCTSRT